ncbi:hypothetical protein QAD02_007654 [Eretmocerus hayati]|uniref:Uncharacterized protein n=1 Tax=Eretmocerus hayati TaxID=131215 RepID=A0ACC2N4K3_9HYME|nr:hypothetical protein QAD02_007654 [Eretmocerus hayati]
MAGHRSRRSVHRDHDESREDRRSRSRERWSRSRQRRDRSRSRDRSHDRYHQNRHRRSGSHHTPSPQVTRAENGESDLAKLAQILSEKSEKPAARAGEFEDKRECTSCKRSGHTEDRCFLKMDKLKKEKRD